MSKSIIKGGTFTSSAAGAVTFTPTANFGQSLADYNSMDVILNVSSFAGTSTTPSVQEQFSGIGFVETGNYGAISAAGIYIICHDGQSGQTGTPNIKYGFGVQGKGIQKQVVFTNASVTSLAADVYFQFYNQ